jgi:Tol biopolymer transport system component
MILFVLLSGCNDGSRLAHYREGGSYVGAGPCASPNGKTILFSSPRSGNGDLYRVDIDGGDTARLTSDPRYECDGTYAPDGKRIAFIGELNNEGSLWIMDANGTGEKKLTKGQGDEGGPSFSADGSAIVFWRTVPELRSQIGVARARELFLINVKNGVETRLTDNQVEDVYPSFSPDNMRLAFTRDGQTWICDRSGKNGKLLGSGFEPSFSPDGKQIVVVAGQYGQQIDLINIDGSNRRTIFSKNTTVSHPVFMPDGLSVLFLEQRDGRGVGFITRMSLDGADVRRISYTW